MKRAGEAFKRHPNLLIAVAWLAVGIIGIFTGWQYSIVALWWISIAALMMPAIADEIQDWKKRRDAAGDGDGNLPD